MSRLWVRISIAFALVSLIALFLVGIAVRVTYNAVIDPPSPPPPAVLAYFEANRPRMPSLPLLMGGVALVAIVAGVYLSRTLTAPLARLEQAAHAIGRQDFGQRVEARGSQELVAVASAFNDMAGKLEQEELLRRNLLADVTHELRHPVHLLQGNLHAILDDVYPLDKQEIARLYDQTQQLSVLVDDLYVLAQAEAYQLPLQKRDTDIAALVKETAAAYQAQLDDKHIALRVELLGAVPASISVDAARLRQVMQNLLNNAIRHTPPQGHITIGLEQEAGSLTIRVIDDGEGLTATQLEHVFERFYRGDEARGRGRPGTGLGLAIVKAIVELHGGTVTAASPGPGQGSTFTIALPLRP